MACLNGLLGEDLVLSLGSKVASELLEDQSEDVWTDVWEQNPPQQCERLIMSNRKGTSRYYSFYVFMLNLKSKN